MPLTLDKFFLQISEKAGIPATDPKLVELLSSTELNRINVPDEVVNNIERSLLSVEDAKNNHPAIKTHYFAEVMSNIDRSLEKIYDEFEFTDEEKAELNRERSSTKRIPLVASKLKERGEAAAAGSGKGSEKVVQLTNTINELNGQLATIKETVKTKEKEHATALQAIKLDTAIAGRLSGIKTTLDTLPSDVKAMSIKNLLTKELQDNSIKFILDESGGLKILRNDDSNYFDENNRQVSVDDFIQRTLAKNKVLPQSPAPPKQGEQEGPPTTIVDGKPKNGNYSLKDLMKETEESLGNQNPVSMLNTAQ